MILEFSQGMGHLLQRDGVNHVVRISELLCPGLVQSVNQSRSTRNVHGPIR
jgi:hypothetical protein